MTNPILRDPSENRPATARAEMPALRAILGRDAKPRVIIVERNSAIAPDIGAGHRPVIEDALRELGVETRLGASVTALDKSGVTLSDGERIEAETVIWAAGFRAAPFTGQIPRERDNLARLLVDRDSHVPSVPGVRTTAFAMLLTNPAFPMGPYRFINREYFIMQYWTDPEALRLMPEPLVIIEPVVNCEFIRMPAGFGDYNESAQVIPRNGGDSHSRHGRRNG